MRLTSNSFIQSVGRSVGRSTSQSISQVTKKPILIALTISAGLALSPWIPCPPIWNSITPGYWVASCGAVIVRGGEKQGVVERKVTSAPWSPTILTIHCVTCILRWNISRKESQLISLRILDRYGANIRPAWYILPDNFLTHELQHTPVHCY